MKQDASGQSSDAPSGIAIIGMSGRFPGAPDVAAFWRNLCDGVESITRFSDAELEDAFDPATRGDPNFVRARAVLDGADLFDAGFFGIRAREAELTDPQHRIFLECAWHALEDGGYDPARYEGAIGVFAGSAMNTYFLRNVCQDREAVELFTSNFQVGSFPEVLGAVSDFLATRVSYKLDLRGPSVTIQSACSTSLVAVAEACQSLLLYQCDMALAGGVSITLPQRRGYLAQEGALASASGRCRTFDAKADGTVFGAGAGVVLLKRVEDALADGDHIYAVIRGSALNNDGGGRAGFTAPSASGQAEVIASALAAADVDARTISYVECHGTATPLGDPIEVAGLTKAFRASTDDVGFCALGSVKPNVGHLDAAAGVTGLIKTALALENEKLPATLFFETPNPYIQFEGGPFFVNSALRDWPRGAKPRRAGVSAFGVGGTNAHAVLEEAPAAISEPSLRPVQVIVASARSEAALSAARKSLADHFRAHPEISLADAAYTLQAGRRGFSHRCAIVCADAASAAHGLETGDGLVAGSTEAVPPSVAFMFPGQGAQYPGMGADLFRNEPVFRASMRRSAEILQPLLGRDLCALLYGEADQRLSAEELQATEFAQPALFAVGYALARLWISWGVNPDMMIGHSVGEFVAACLAGVFLHEDALALIAARGRLMQEMPRGSMLAVRLPEAELVPLLTAPLALAAVNGPKLCVAAGPDDAVAELDALLTARNIPARRLHTSHAFHTPMMEPAAAALLEKVSKVRLSPPKHRLISSTTGRWLTAAEATSPAYWAEHCRAPVRFGDGLAALLRDGAATGRGLVLIEAGPGATLSTLARQGGAGNAPGAVLASLPDAAREATDDAVIARSIAQLWCAGVTIDWRGLHTDAKRLRLSLPAYPFERSRYWIDAPPRAQHEGITPIEAQPTKALPIEPHSPLTAEDFELTDSVATDGPSSMLAALSRPEETKTLMAKIDRSADLHQRILALLENLSGDPVEGVGPETTFLDMGFDSLFLSQVTQQLQREFKVKLTFRQLLGEFSTLPALVRFLDSQLPPEPAPVEPAPVETAPALLAPVAAQPVRAATQTGPAAAETVVEQIIREQLDTMGRLMAQQLDALRGAGAGQAPAQAQKLPAPPSPAPNVRLPAPAQADAPVRSEAPPAPAGQNEPKSRFEMLAAARNAPAAQMTPAQQRSLAALTERFNARTKESKRQTAQNRPVLADPRVASAFRPEWKDLVYPIISNRAAGSRIWDVDGNEYFDLVNGYGQTAFGHAPSFVVDAVAEQLQKGFPIGPQAELAGRVAALFSELTGNERVTFCNTGSEAVMAAMRIARTVTGRSPIVMFTGDYHGQFDEVLVKGVLRNGAARSMAASAGIPKESVENMVVLPYGAPESLEWIRAHASELAAVMVEPVQSRHPELRPVAFLKEIRAITEASGAALIFDEVVTGFRNHPGGMQAIFGIRADLATYGKVVGGGLPVGILAGKAAFMDALDGGQWQYGDDSYPEVGVTFFAGTFVRHPLVLAAVWAVLNHVKREGPALQERLTARTAALVERLNRFLTQRGLDVRIETYGSLFLYNFATVSPYAALFVPHMLERGVYIQDGYPCFLTTAHSDDDLTKIAEAFESSVIAMQDAKFFPSLPGAALDAPLTEAQSEIWLATQLSDEASCAFNESVTLRMRGALDRNAMQTALDQLIARHEALRGAFEPSGERMRIAPRLNVTIAERDLGGLEPEAAEAAWRDLLAADAVAAFDLVNGPLVRACLVRRAADDHALVLTVHHIVGDGWSINIMIDELTKLYESARTGAPADLPEPMSFAGYAEDEKARLEGQGDETDAFWLPQFSPLPKPLDLPSDRPRGALKTYNGGTITRTIEAPLTQRLRKAAARQGCTLFVALLAAFETLLGRLAGQDEVVVGIPAAGQSLVDSESLVGHCVNFLPLVGRWDETTSVAQHLAETRRIVLAAFENQSFTLGTLMRKLPSPRPWGGRALVEASFNLERIGDRIRLPELEIEAASNPKRFVNFDIFFNITEQDGGLRVDCDYNTDLFDAATIDRWIGHYRTLIDAISTDIAVHEGSRPVNALTLLTEAERAQLIKGVSPAALALTAPPVHEQFTAMARMSPNAIAVVCDGAQSSYSELDARSNQAARRLASLGVSPGDFVGLLAQRSIDTIVAILGILKAGAVYVPLDPSYPPDLLAFMLKDCGPKLTLGQEDLTSASEFEGLPFAEIRSFLAAAAAESDSPLALSRDAADLAYVMYTSGSTGRPKGVMIPHRAIVRLVTGQTYVHFGPDEVFLHAAPLAFDASTFEIWGPLLNGGRVAIVGDPRPSLDDIVETIQRNGVTTAWFTAGLFNLLIEQRLDGLKQLRTIVAGGDVLSPSHVEKALAGLPATALVNGYGPTENTTFTCCYKISRSDWRGGPVPVGAPIEHTEVYILGSDLEPVPVGVAGQLCAGGLGLATGYLNRPELTAEKFISNPFRAGDKIYLTGDLARRRADGMIEFLGRRDAQVKINGKRVEIEEIENVLRSDPRIADAVVAVREENGGKRIDAYVKAAESAASNDGGAFGKDAIAFLRSKLPDHMIPSSIVTLDAFPLTPNGKVDRRKLPAPDAVRAKSPDIVPPTPDEAKLVAIWAETLKVDCVGVNDNFFDLGGDALQAMKAAALATQAGLRLTMGQIYDHPTIAELAALAGEARGMSAVQGVVEGEAPLTPIQHWFLDSDPAEPHYFNQSFLLVCRKKILPDLLEKAIAACLVHHDALRLRFDRASDGWRQFNAGLGGKTPFETIDLSRLGRVDQDVALERGAAELQASLDLQSGPLVRAALFDLGENRGQRLLLIIHHLAVDMVSWGLLLEDLHSAYQHLEAGSKIELPGKTTSFKSWALQLKEYAGTAKAQAEAEYWLGLPWRKVAPLPVDRLAPDNSEASSRLLKVSLSAEETRELLRETPRAYRTQINDVLLTALSQAVANWTGGDNVLVGLEGHGREDLIPGVDLSRTVGWFTSLFPVLLQVDRSGDDGQAIMGVKEQLRAMPNRGVGYGVLRYLGGVEALARLPEPEIAFNYLGEWDDGIADTPLFGLASEKFGPDISPRGIRPRLVDIYGWVVDGRLQLDWTYSVSRYDPATIESLADDFLRNLRRLIAHCKSLAREDAASVSLPLSTAEANLAAIWADVLKVGSVGPHDNFFELGGHSLLAMRLVARVTSDFGVKLRINSLFEAPTLREFSALIARLQPAKETAEVIRLVPEREAGKAASNPDVSSTDGSSSIVVIQPDGDKTPIIAIHNTLMYYNLSRKIGRDRPFLGIKLFDPTVPFQLPAGSMQEIAADYVDLIRAVRPHGPYILTGLCSAGVIAFEAARQLQEAGESVPLVITADTVMPDCWSHQTFRQRVVSRVRALVRTNLHRIDQFRRGEASFVEVLSQLIIVRKSRVLDLAAWLGLIDSAQQGQDDRATWLFLCALDVAHENYAAPTPFSGEVVVFQSDQLECDGDPTFGWSRLVDGGVYVHRVPGWHEGIFQGEGPAEMAAFLQPLLEAADLKSEPGPLSAVRS